MSENIEEILENYVYHMDGSNITGDGSEMYNALIDAKQIAAKVEQIQDIWFEDTDADKVEHAKKLHKLSKDLQEVIKVKSLREIWNKLSEMERKPQTKITVKEASWRKRDLLADISLFYVRFEKENSKYIEALEAIGPEETLDNFESITEDFKLHATNLAETMDDLDYRMSTLMRLIDPSFTNNFIMEICPYTKVCLISERCAILTKLVPDKHGLLELCRLIRRMGIVLNENKFIKLSERDQKRYDIIERLSKFSSYYKKDEGGKDRIKDLVKKMDKLRTFARQQRRMGVQICMKSNSDYKKVWIQRETFDFSSEEHAIALAKTTLFFKEICYVYETILGQFYEIRLEIAEVWNAI